MNYSDIPRFRSAISMRCVESGMYTFTGSAAATFTLPNVNPAQMRPEDARLWIFKNAGTAVLTIGTNSGNIYNGVAATTMLLAQGQSCVILSSGTQYEVVCLSGVPLLLTANRPAWSAALVGMVYADSATGKLFVAGASAWEAVTSAV